jgi:enoyl-CoA hydratase/carnithine racemase
VKQARGRRGAAVEVAIHDGAAWLTLARPAARNRLDGEMMGALVEACGAAEDAVEARVVVLGARGPVFSAGLPAGRAWPDAAWPDGVGALAAVGKPVIVAIGGVARGWGVALALAGDLRLAARGAALVLPEVRAGRLPGGGVTQRLTRMIGPARTLELLLLRQRVTAAEAAAWGLVSRVVPRSGLAAAVAETVGALVARGPVALRFAKEAVSRALDLPLDDGMRLEHDLYAMLQTTEDRREGIRAFLERRKPQFHAR